MGNIHNIKKIIELEGLVIEVVSVNIGMSRSYLSGLIKSGSPIGEKYLYSFIDKYSNVIHKHGFMVMDIRDGFGEILTRSIVSREEYDKASTSLSTEHSFLAGSYLKTVISLEAEFLNIQSRLDWCTLLLRESKDILIGQIDKGKLVNDGTISKPSGKL